MPQHHPERHKASAQQRWPDLIQHQCQQGKKEWITLCSLHVMWLLVACKESGGGKRPVVVSLVGSPVIEKFSLHKQDTRATHFFSEAHRCEWNMKLFASCQPLAGFTKEATRTRSLAMGTLPNSAVSKWLQAVQLWLPLSQPISSEWRSNIFKRCFRCKPLGGQTTNSCASAASAASAVLSRSFTKDLPWQWWDSKWSWG